MEKGFHSPDFFKYYKKRLYILSSLLFALIILGTSGYMIIEKWDFLDSLYMVVITLATVGYKEVKELSPAGEIYTIILILTGSGFLAYSLTNIVMMLVEGKLGEILRSKKMKKEIERMHGHFIVCGAGKTGIHIIDELRKLKQQVVVIDLSPPSIEDVPWIQKDATCDSTLLEAGVMKAKGLASALSTDKENLFVVLTAKNLNPSLRIVAKCVDEESEIKLKIAGADSVVSPNRIGGLRIASELVRPAVVTFLDKMLRAGGGTLRIEEARVSSGSLWAERNVGDLKKEVENKFNVLLVAISKKGNYIFNPPSSVKLEPEDVLIVMGEIDSIIKMRQIL